MAQVQKRFSAAGVDRSSRVVPYDDGDNQVGHVMGMQTITGFVEDEQTRDELKRLGVDFVQGHAVHKPEPLGLEEPAGVKNRA